MRTAIKDRRIELIAAGASILLSLWLLFFDNVINNDAVLYLKSAEAFASGNWNEAIEIYRWPFYAALIAAVHQISGLDVDVAAYVLNGVFYVLLICVYLAIVRMCGASDRTLLFAALFILALPALNDYRTFVIRDIGFWTFYLLGLLSLLKFQLRPSTVAALAWGVAMTVATLFRIEGVAFLCLLPLVVLWRPRAGFRRALWYFTQLNIVLMAGAIWFVAQGPHAFTGRLLEPLMWAHMFGDQLGGGLLAKADALRQHVLAYYSRDFAVPGVLAILLLILVTYIAKSLGLLGIASIAYAWTNRVLPLTPEIRRTLVMAVALNLAVLTIFLTPQFFLTGRYVLPLTLTFALLVPFGLNRIYVRWCDRPRDRAKSAWLFPLAMLLLAGMAIDSLWSFGVSKAYLKEAGLWLRANTPAETRLYSESMVVGFYAEKSGDEWKRSQPALSDVLKANALGRYDFVVVSPERHGAVPKPLALVRPVREFRNEKNDRVLIFKTIDIANVQHRTKAHLADNLEQQPRADAGVADPFEERVQGIPERLLH